MVCQESPDTPGVEPTSDNLAVMIPTVTSSCHRLAMLFSMCVSITASKQQLALVLFSWFKQNSLMLHASLY